MWREREKLLQNAVEVPHLHIARHIKYLPFGLEIAFQSRSVGEEKHFFFEFHWKITKHGELLRKMDSNIFDYQLFFVALYPPKVIYNE